MTRLDVLVKRLEQYATVPELLAICSGIYALADLDPHSDLGRRAGTIAIDKAREMLSEEVGQ